MSDPIQRLIDSLVDSPIEYVSGEYIGSTKSKCTFKCKEDGHIFERLWRTVVVGRVTTCPICNGARFNNQKIDSELQKFGYTRIGSYKNAQEKFAVKCPLGHITEVRWSNFSRGHRCKVCSDTKHSDVSIDNELQKHGYNRNGPYVGVFERLRMLCPNGHSIEMQYNDFRKGSRCGVCYLESKNDYDKARQYAASQGYEFLTDGKSKEKIQMKCPEGHVFQLAWGKFMSGTRCNICSGSYWEQDFHNFLKSLGVEYRYQVRDIIDGEIDFLVGKVGIELHGSYFHSERYREHSYHFKKHVKCRDAGIQLIQIFDHEWSSKPDLMKSYLKSKFGIFEDRIHARDCVVDLDVPRDEVKRFIDENHLQGYSGHLEAYSLRYNHEVVACITLNRHHRDASTIILNRLCSKVGVKIDGGFERLFASIPMKHGLITHADLRFTDGSIYRRLGFVEDGFLRPDYYYTKNGRVFSKQSLKKTKEERETNLSEKDLRSLQGYLRVYDAGKIRFRFP